MADDIERQVLDAASELFYRIGISGVGVKEVRDLAGVSLNGLYRRFPGKAQLVTAYLERRHESWLGSLRAAVASASGREERLTALFDWLEQWFAEPGFNGCAFINARGEQEALEAEANAVLDRHARELTDVLGDVAYGELDREDLYLLVEGAIIAARTGQGPDAARRARRLAEASAAR